MAILRSTKVRLIAHQSQEQELLQFLQDQESFHVSTNSDPRKDADHTATHMWGRIESALNFLRPFISTKRPFSEMLMGEKVESSPEKVREIANTFEIEKTLEEIESLEHQKSKAESALTRATEKILVLENWKDITASPSFQDSKIQYTFARFPIAQENEVKDSLSSLPKMSHWEEFSRTKESFMGLFVFNQAEANLISQYIHQNKGEELQFETHEKSPLQQYQEQKDEASKLKSEIHQIELSISQVAKNADTLKMLSDYYSWEKQRESARQQSSTTDSTSIFEGWILQSGYKGFHDSLQKHFPETHLEKLGQQEEESAPIELKNNGFFKSFEVVTKMPGMPTPSQIDPTPFLTPFFIFFFAFCLTDAGYGILLTGLSIFGLKYFKTEKDTKLMLKLLLYTGIMTIILGALFGGWFGISVEKLPMFLQKMQIFDPIPDLMSKLAPLALGAGFIQLLLGVILNGVKTAKNGALAVAIQTSFALTVFLGVSIAWGASFYLGNEALSSTLKIPFFLLLAVMIWGYGSGTKNPIGRVFLGSIGLVNEAISWVSYLFSYCRLFALGLATGMVASVFNDLAFIIGDLIPVPGVNLVFIVGIILFGHSLNIGLNLLSAFIHSARLQFIEFFAKFVSNGGNEFSPLKKDSRYLFISA